MVDVIEVVRYYGTKKTSALMSETEQEIISEEIVDETDRYEDNFHKVKARRMTTAAVMRGSVSSFLISFTPFAI